MGVLAPLQLSAFLAPRPFPSAKPPAVLTASDHSLLPGPSYVLTPELLGGAGGLGPSGCLVAIFANLREPRALLVPLSSYMRRGSCAKFLALLLLLVFTVFFSVDVHQVQGWGFHGSHCLFPSNLHQSYISQFALFVFQ